MMNELGISNDTLNYVEEKEQLLQEEFKKIDDIEKYYSFKVLNNF